ncbi:MAG: hypothetical protein KAG10_05290 [Methylococcales bacterium]|nr:hypothetical protein [Methylococcales bacterium]
MKKTVLSLAVSLLLLSGSSFVFADAVEKVGFSHNESHLNLKKRLNLKKLKLTAEKLKKFGKDEFEKLEPKVLSFFDENNMKDLPANVFAGISLAQFSQIDSEGLKGLTIAQFDKIPSNILKALKAENLGYLNEDVLGEFSLEDVLALEDGQLKTASTKDLSRLLVNIGKKHIGKGINQKIKPSDLKRFLPVGWTINEEGELIIPEGEPLALPSVLAPINLVNNILLPNIPNLTKGFGLYGVGNPFLLGMNAALKQANLGQYSIEQDDKGILHVKGGEGFDLAFIPDTANM